MIESREKDDNVQTVDPLSVIHAQGALVPLFSQNPLTMQG